MNKEQHHDERLSALMDGALDEQQLQSFMQSLKRDPVEDAEVAQRYRLMGDVMRDELDQSSFMDMSAAVHRAIEQEPSHNEVVRPVKKKMHLNLLVLLSSWIKPLTGMAVAASVAMVTLVTFNTLQSTNNVEQPAQLVRSLPAERIRSDVSRNVQIASTLNISNQSAEQQKLLNNYMLQHSGYASQFTMQGMMPYVRAADVKKQEIMREKN